jgi:hypothetical protein
MSGWLGVEKSAIDRLGMLPVLLLPHLTLGSTRKKKAGEIVRKREREMEREGGIERERER